MQTYKDSLINEGFTPERAEAVSNALDTLHSAVSKLDSAGRARFFETSLEQRLSDYAIQEGISDVTKCINRNN